MEQKHPRADEYEQLDRAPLRPSTPSRNFVHLTDVVPSALTAGFFLSLVQYANLNLNAKYSVPALGIFLLTELFLYKYYQKERPRRSNYNFVMDSFASAGSVTVTTAATKFAFPAAITTAATMFTFSAATLFPVIATGLVAPMVAVGTVRFLSRITKLGYDAWREYQLEPDVDERPHAKRSITEGVFQNFYVTASITSGILFTCWKNGVIGKTPFFVWSAVNFGAHFVLNGVKKYSGNGNKDAWQSTWSDWIAFSCVNLLPYFVFTATFATTGAAATIVSGTAAIIAINIGATVVAQGAGYVLGALSQCAATFFKNHREFDVEKEFTATSTANKAADEEAVGRDPAADNKTSDTELHKMSA